MTNLYPRDLRSILILVVLLLLPCSYLVASTEPYMVETKVQTDLDNLLSRLMPKEQYLVQVSTEVGLRSEKKMMEGESFENSFQQKEVIVPPMPGFFPEVEIKPEGKPVQTRQVYRTVETPELKKLRVYVRFDDQVTPVVVSRAKLTIQDYLKSTYPEESVLNFASMTMFKPPKEIPKVIEPVKEIPKPPLFEDQLWSYARWGVLGLLFAILMLSFKRAFPDSVIAGAGSLWGGGRHRESDGDEFSKNRTDSRSFVKASGNRSAHERGSQEEAVAHKRKSLLDKLLNHAESFKLYFQTLSEEQKRELCSALRGPALDSLMSGLEISAPSAIPQEVPEVEERMTFHEKNFDEYVLAKEWQDRQFFGFLNHLGKEQLISLVKSNSAQAASVILRFMKPQQSASILAALPPARQLDIISHAHEIHKMPLSDLTHIERELRTSVTKVPARAYGPGQEDVQFWGNILTETTDQDRLLDALEQSNPGIVPKLKKYRFNLEDAASLPNSMLEKVLREVENEELCLALMACSPDVAETLLDAVSPNRREHLSAQVESMGKISSDQKQHAKLGLTRKLREALA